MHLLISHYIRVEHIFQEQEAIMYTNMKPKMYVCERKNKMLLLSLLSSKGKEIFHVTLLDPRLLR